MRGVSAATVSIVKLLVGAMVVINLLAGAWCVQVVNTFIMMGFQNPHWAPHPRPTVSPETKSVTLPSRKKKL
jgi:hypothetical protein